MSTVKITYSGPAALVVAEANYTEQDWNEAAYELGRRGFTLTHDEADHVMPCGTEVFVWTRNNAPHYNLDNFDLILVQAKDRTR